MLEIERFDLDEIAFALSDQNPYDEHRHLINPETGEIILWTREGGIDGTNPIDLDDLDLPVIRPLPSPDRGQACPSGCFGQLHSAVGHQQPERLIAGLVHRPA